MKKIGILLLTLLFLCTALSLPPLLAAENPQVVSVSLANNTTFYNNTDRPLSTLNVTGYLVDGTAVDLTGNGRVRYSSSNPSAFSFGEGEDANKAKSNTPGYAILTAEYQNPDETYVSASVYMDRSTSTVAGNSTFESLTDTTVSESAVYLAGIPGHDGKKAGATSGKGYVGESWKTYNQGLRAAQGWFYDSGERSNANAALSINVTLGWQREIGIVDSSSDHYGVRKNGTTLLAQTQAARTRGWHQVAVIYDANAKLAVIYIDGEEVLKESYSANVSSPAGGDRFYFSGGAYKDVNGNFYESVYDDISVTNLSGGYHAMAYKPVAEQVGLSGTAMINGVLTVNAVFSDKNGDDTLGTPQYQWQTRAGAQSAWSDIAGATTNTYTCTAEDVGKQLRARVTPVSVEEPVLGNPVYSNVVTVSQVKNPPSITGDVTITGTAQAGNMLTAQYTYQMSAGGDPEGDSGFLWERGETAGGPWETVWNKNGKEGKQYLLTAADAGQFIRVTVTPKDSNGLAGEAKVSVNPVEVETDVATLEFFVAADGDDTNPGTLSAPFATLEKARDAVRAAKADGTAAGRPVTVTIRGGEYFRGNAFSLTADDSGTETAPVTYRAYPGEKVTLTGGKRIADDKISKVTDPAILNRVLDPFAKSNLMQIDLSADVSNIAPIGEFAYGITDGNFENQFEVYVNGAPLQKSRWPNDEPGTQYTYVTGVQGDNVDYKTSPATFTYQDDEGRTALWPEEALKNLWIEGHLAYSWAQSKHAVASLNAETKTITTKDKTAHRPTTENGKFYFFNLLEEIDMPGESYIDRENKKVYFYPPCDMEEAEVVVPVSKTTLVSVSGASHIKIEGINMEYLFGSGLSVQSCDNVVVDGCTIAHTTNRAYINGTNNTIRNCYIYDSAYGGMNLSGGDRVSLTPGNNLAENNRIHSVNRIVESYAGAITITGVGNIIRGNELYNGPHLLINVDGNDHIIEYNDIHDAVLNAADMGAIYYGRTPTRLGIEIRYNYFHDIGNPYGGYGQQSVFWDDGQVGPYIHGNVFYRGALTEEQGGEGYALKTFGGSYARVTNNVFVDSPSAIFFQPFWLSGFAAEKQGKFWLGVYSKQQNDTMGWWDSMNAVQFESETWKNHYAGTQWQEFLDSFSTAFYNENLKNLDPNNAEDYKKLVAFANQYAPVQKNEFSNNVAVKMKKGLPTMQGQNGVETNTYRADSDILPSGQPMFADYGRDFTLTEAGLQAIQNAGLTFEEIPFGRMGLHDYTLNGETKSVGGHKPSATQAMVGGEIIAGRTITAQYTYSDQDGDKQGPSKIVWYTSDSENGTYKKIPGKEGRELLLDQSLNGKYIRYEVTPYDSNMLYGETVTSESVQVGGELPPYERLAQKIEEAQALNSVIAAGNDYGQAPADAKSAFASAIDTAKSETSTDADVIVRTIAALQAAVEAFQTSVNTDVPEITANMTLNIPPFVDVTNIIVPSGASGVKATVPCGVELGEINLSGWVTVDGKQRAVSLKIPAGAKLEGTAGTRAEIALFSASATPSQTISGAKDITAVVFGQKLPFTSPVRLAIEGVYNKKLGRIVDSQYAAVTATIKNDTAESAKDGLKNRDIVKVSGTSPDMILWADTLGEITLFSNDTAPTPTITAGPIGPGGGGTSTTTYPSVGAGNPIGVTATEQPSNGGAWFADTVGHWAQKDIEEMAEKGIVSGVTADTFEPERAVTRAEFATLIAKALQLTSSSPAGFSDVEQGEWYYTYVNAAANTGIIAGSDGTFRPDDRITREEMAVILCKAYGFLEKTASRGGIERFSDRDAISEWAYAFVDEATTAGLISGMTADTFAPLENTTRAQAASVIKRLLEK